MFYNLRFLEYHFQFEKKCRASRGTKGHPAEGVWGLFAYNSITVSSASELTSVSMRYAQRGEVNTSLSSLMYCTHE